MSKFVDAKNRAELAERVGRDWARVVKVEGGYMVFDTLDDYRTWKGQK